MQGLFDVFLSLAPSLVFRYASQIRRALISLIFLDQAKLRSRRLRAQVPYLIDGRKVNPLNFSRDGVPGRDDSAQMPFHNPEGICFAAARVVTRVVTRVDVLEF